MSLAAVILCAGKSTRMQSEKSKVLHAFCEKPIGSWPVLRALQIGCNPVVPVVGHQALEVKKTLSYYSQKSLLFALQKEQKGTGHAVQIACKKLADFDGTVLVLCGDTPLLKKESLQALCRLQKQKRAKLAMVTAKLSNPSGYGRVIRDGSKKIAKIVEDKEASKAEKLVQEINVGIYAFESDFLKRAIKTLKPSQKKKELLLTDLVFEAARLSQVVSISMPAQEALGINDFKQLAEAEKMLRQKINEKWMAKGVRFQDPNTTYVGPDVVLGKEVTLEANVHLRGKTHIQKGAYIETGAILTDTKVSEGTVVKAYSICEAADLGKDVQVGPFARLREGSVLKNNAKVGNFVETKKTVLEAYAKANHLAYLGDAKVGKKTNVGAGTITCNYDGFKKHQTVLGDEVFVGSNSTLVAPLKVEAKAYVAAGSVITKNVPKEDLAVARSRQENKKGYGNKIRQKLSR